MLRPKPISNLSSTARQFFLSGTRCNSADGNSCSCSEDENCISTRQHIRNVSAVQKSSTLVPRTSVRAGALILGDAFKPSNPHNVQDADHSHCPTKVVSAAPTTRRLDSVSYASSFNAVEKDGMLSSPPIADQVVRAGVAAVNLLSDLANGKIPDGSQILHLPKKCMVDSTFSKVKPSTVKPVQREKFEKVNSKSTVDAPPGSHTTSNYIAPKDKGNKAGFVRDFKRVSTSSTTETHGVPSKTCDKRKTIPHRPKACASQFSPNFSRIQTSDAVIQDCTTEGFKKYPRDMKHPLAPFARQFVSSGQAVESVCRILQQLRWGPATEEALGKLNFSLDAYQANQVLKQLQDQTVALAFFYWLKRQAGFKHDGHTYTTMVGILGRARQFSAINKLLDQMVRDGCQPNVVTYNRMIHSYGRANYLNEAVNVFNLMQKAGCEPDRVTYCTLIDIHAKAGFLDFAMEMYERMQMAGLSPDTFTYSVIINCLGKAGHLAAAHKLFSEMVAQGCVPNLVTYNIMIALQAKARNYQSALKLYRDMQNAGFEPDKVTYSIVMEVLGHCGHLDEAEAVFTEMKRKNWIPDEPVYGLLVDLWGKAGHVEKAWEWYQAMVHAGLRPNVPTCNSLLSAFLRVHRLVDAYNLLQSMLGLGLYPSLQTYTLLLSCCTEAQSPYEMGFCCKLMGVTGHPAHMFLLSMPQAGPDGQNLRDHVGRFLDLMHSEDRESKRGLVDSVVDFLHKSGLKEEAGSVWEVAALKNVYPDAVKEKSSCYWLINLHVMSDGTAVTALSRTLAWFRRQMMTSGVSPSRIDIVTGWGRRSRVTGSSLVRQAVQELLNIFSFPFFTENGNSGCFVGCGEPLNRWLLQSYVERMHLL
ncbi:pentatricopeptide repeat-containing protein [Tripterygium wilfordii]|uniref:Pentatricopeptide repeat-containing protein n=1 Tax=Tripterygium wilfordii TaxID=458696 RepID=A0A7J7CJI0_TRIWF|nr:pentatricopeptide repeat-containing protein At1g18900-like [Tripterygium wilfordii]XP_038679369.1 pentatricopeptide repeat-containing protein At1g18900-like [Tripterygium wilfordii]XP_038679370.1 pentatricopeptide repeat-containing protein At1g18900-like [Tripterygium wilfordii]XP_038679372.1 pentatricopeptide repeat-containing protein At1g18900-like [Tripterygium wilfordii]XP_038679373.1 pentatricopeptide repeat-containing protein At1g18900-like [Tripterygium wilfordii]XP_038679374.1 penta